jgi:cell division septation protein DedD
MSQHPDTQLEWFDLPAQPSGARRNRQTWWVVEPLRVRADHAVLGLILALVSGSVVFAVGIERGKSVSRAERWLDTSVATSMEPAVPAPNKMAPTVDGKRVPPMPVNTSTSPSTPSPKAVPGMRKPQKSVAQTPGKGTAAGATFAVQVVSYSQPQLAQRELQRLQQRGESAFLVVANNRTVLMVGPFGSRDRASAKLPGLKQLYRDCFVRTL